MLFPVSMGPRQPVAARPEISSEIRFGWTKKSPPTQQNLSLTTDDFDSQHMPTARFIEKISPLLMRGKQLELPGFITIPDLECYIPANRIDNFLQKTMVELKKHLSQAYAFLFNPNQTPLTLLKKRQLDGKISKMGNLHNEETKGRWTLKSPHFDRNALLVLHRYEPTENVKDGNLEVIDVNQFLKDHPEHKFEHLLNPDKTLQKEYIPLLKPYTYGLLTNTNKPTVVLLNNTIQNGVAHSVSPMQPIDCQKPIQRAFDRYTISGFEPNKILPADVIRIQE